jgi:cobalt-zinc-cadmium efflux system outer membrane protein
VPFPSFQAGVEWNDPTDATRGATILIGFSLPLPLWQTGGAPAAAARARAADAAARLREARAEGAAALAQVGVRVTEAAARARTARDSIFPLARRQRELAFAAYRAGDTGIIPLLDALRAERQVSRDLVSDLVAFQQAWADWLALVAGNQ